MIKNGQASIKRVEFANSSAPGLAIELLDLEDAIRRVGREHFARPHRLTFFQVAYVRSGTLPVEIDFVRDRVPAGSFVVVRPGQVQRIDMEHPCRVTMLLFEPQFVGIHLSPGVLRRLPIVLTKPPRQIRGAYFALKSEFEGLQNSGEDESFSRSILQHQLIVLLLRLLRCGGDPERSQPLLIAFEELLEKWFSSERSVGFYARELGCSEKTLTRSCAAMQDRTAKQFIDQRVILEAKRVLAHGQLPVKALAHDLGFSEVTNFVKFFRRSVGETPSEFRCRMR